MHEAFSRTLESLEHIFDFTGRFFAGRDVEERHRYAVNLVIEELFTNMVKYNASGSGQIEVEMRHQDGGVHVRLSDRESVPFDVTAPRAVDPETPLERRQSGGLGLFLVQKFVDSLDYAYRDGTSTITFTRNLDKNDVRD